MAMGSQKTTIQSALTPEKHHEHTPDTSTFFPCLTSASASRTACGTRLEVQRARLLQGNQDVVVLGLNLPVFGQARMFSIFFQRGAQRKTRKTNQVLKVAHSDVCEGKGYRRPTNSVVHLCLRVLFKGSLCTVFPLQQHRLPPLFDIRPYETPNK